MDTISAIMTRRSVRQFTDEPVTAEQLETLLRAAMAAPSAGNQQPWRFVVARDEATRAKLAVATQYSSPIGRAPVGLVVFGDTRGNKHEGYWVQDCSAAIQNLLVNRVTMWSILRGDPFARILGWADASRASFLQRRAPFLIYK